MEDKLISGVDKLEGSDNKKGALYYSNKFIADERLQTKEKENIRYYGDFLEILRGSKAYGNTMVFNYNMAGYADRHQSSVANYHDAWIYRLAKSIGSDIFLMKMPIFIIGSMRIMLSVIFKNLTINCLI